MRGVVPVCEFCCDPLGSGVVPWTYALTAPLRVEVPEAFGTGTKTWDGDKDGLWCLCGVCHSLVQEGEAARLVQRSLAVDPTRDIPVIAIWKERVIAGFIATIDMYYRGAPWDVPVDGHRRIR